MSVLVGVARVLRQRLSENSLSYETFSEQVLPCLLATVHQILLNAGKGLADMEHLIDHLANPVGGSNRHHARRHLRAQVIHESTGYVEKSLQQLEVEFEQIGEIVGNVGGAIRMVEESVKPANDQADWEDIGRLFGDIGASIGERIRKMRDLCRKLLNTL